MKLIRLTPVSKKDLIPVISVNWITGMEVREPPDFGTVIYVARQGLYHVVRETPEEIERIINSEQNLGQIGVHVDSLLQFAEWLAHRGGLDIGQSYSKSVDAFLAQRIRANE